MRGGSSEGEERTLIVHIGELPKPAQIRRPSPGALRVLLAAVGLLILLAGTARAGDVDLAPKLKPTSLDIRDNRYDPPETIRLWMFRLHPFLRQELEYDSNVYLDEKNGREDAVWFTSMGLRCDLLPGAHELNLGYKARIYEYVNSGSLDRIEHVGDIRGVLAFSDFRIEFSNILERLRDPLNFWFTRAIDRLVDTAQIKAAVKLGRFKIGGEYQFQWYDFRHSFDPLDHFAHKIAGQVRMEISPRVEIMADYTFGTVRYLNSGFDDFDTHTVYAGIGGLLTSKIRAMAKIGYIYQSLRSRHTGDPAFRGFSGLLTVSWTPTENLKVDASYGREVEISQFRSYQIVDRIEIKVEQYFGTKVAVRLYALGELTDPADRDNPALPDADEWFFRVSAGLQIEYQIQEWMAVGAWLGWQYRHTDIPGQTYRQVRVGAHITVFF